MNLFHMISIDARSTALKSYSELYEATENAQSTHKISILLCISSEFLLTLAYTLHMQLLAAAGM